MESKTQANKKYNKLPDTENRLIVAKSEGWRVRAMGKGSQNIQTPNYKINWPWGHNVEHGDCG